MRKLLTAALAAFLISVPVVAQAHDDEIATSPASEVTSEAGAFDVSVTFDENILVSSGNQGIVLEVKGPNGELVSNGCATVTSNVLSTPIDVDQPGTYSVAWRSISSDGHPKEGAFEFALENSTGYVSAGVPAISEQCAASEASSPEATDNSALIGLAIAIGLVALGSVAGALRFGKTKPKG